MYEIFHSPFSNLKNSYLDDLIATRYHIYVMEYRAMYTLAEQFGPAREI
jgi:hypothetical protein